MRITRPTHLCHINNIFNFKSINEKENSVEYTTTKSYESGKSKQQKHYDVLMLAIFYFLNQMMLSIATVHNRFNFLKSTCTSFQKKKDYMH